jgi:hypothetical protein
MIDTIVIPYFFGAFFVGDAGSLPAALNDFTSCGLGTVPLA